MSIHILGLGNIGLLFASTLRHSGVRVVLLFHRDLSNAWKAAGSQITTERHGVSSATHDYDIEFVHLGPESPASQRLTSPISNLIVCTKANDCFSALAPLKGRLNAESTILFTQNGIGFLQPIVRDIFPEHRTRPLLLNSITTHGAHKLSPFSFVHASIGTLDIASPPGSSREPQHQQQQHRKQGLIGLLSAAPFLHVNRSLQSCTQMLAVRLQKLVVNCVINPLTVIHNCRNGEIFSIPAASPLIDEIISECSALILCLPDFQVTENQSKSVRAEMIEIRTRFTASKLREKVEQVARLTGENISSMLQDVRSGRETELCFINGWVVRRGREVGLDMKTNNKVVGLVNMLLEYRRNHGPAI